MKGDSRRRSTKPSCKPHINWLFDARGKGGNVRFESRGWAKRVLETPQGWDWDKFVRVHIFPLAGRLHTHAFSGAISKNHVVLELCGMDFSITVQTENDMFGRDQDIGTGRFEQNQAEVPTAWWDELAVTLGEGEEGEWGPAWV